MFRALHATFFGKAEASVTLVHKAPRTASLVAVWLLIAAIVIIGVFPRIFTDLLPGSKTVATAQLQGPKS
jgi:NADH:ubiquinone oxidoreductase subunit 4 (subunit M)